MPSIILLPLYQSSRLFGSGPRGLGIGVRGSATLLDGRGLRNRNSLHCGPNQSIFSATGTLVVIQVCEVSDIRQAYAGY